jgi:hypothetical protein
MGAYPKELPMSIWSSRSDPAITGYAKFRHNDADLAFPLKVDVATALPWNDHVRLAAWPADGPMRGSTEMVLKPEDAKKLVWALQQAIDEIDAEKEA